jgi:MarR family transcriptional regulator for hemolysin
VITAKRSDPQPEHTAWKLNDGVSRNSPAGPPAAEPLGLQLTRTAKVVSRAFDDALAAVGGSLPTWLVLVSLKARQHGAQRDLAEAVGVEGPTLTHHLNRLEKAGLITRTRDPENRRVHRVEITDTGEAMFHRLLGAAVAFDHQLRSGLSSKQAEALSRALGQLRANATAARTNSRRGARGTEGGGPADAQ